MKSSKFLLSLLLISIAPLANAAVTISVIYSSSAGYFVMPDGSSLLPDGSLFEYGAFDSTTFAGLSPALQTDFSTVDALFTSYGSFSINGGYITQIGQPLSGGTVGQKMSVFITTPTVDAFGVFSSTNALFNYPADPGGATLSGALTNISYVGQINDLTPDSFQLIAAVPEPAHFAFLFGAFGLGLVLVRRRRS